MHFSTHVWTGTRCGYSISKELATAWWADCTLIMPSHLYQSIMHFSTHVWSSAAQSLLHVFSLASQISTVRVSSTVLAAECADAMPSHVYQSIMHLSTHVW